MDDTKILICCDKFKGSLDAHKVCKSISDGLVSSDSNLQVNIQPMADGGDGSLSILKHKLQLTATSATTIDPLGKTITADYYIKDKHGYIELASASGMWRLAAGTLDIMSTTTLGTGQLIADAVANGCHTISLFLGGSCTNDVGLGILHQLGYKFISASGVPLIPTGGNLLDIKSIVMPSAPITYTMNILCDVTNPLYGHSGAAQVYGPQKGATPAQIKTLDKGMEHIANLIFSATGQRVAEMPGAGATGGIAAGLVGLLPKAVLSNGFQYVKEAVGLEEKIKASDIVICGEGKLDHSSMQGKVVGEVAKLCRAYNKKMVVVVGHTDLEHEYLLSHGVHEVFKLSDFAKSLEDSLTNATDYLHEIGKMMTLHS